MDRHSLGLHPGRRPLRCCDRTRSGRHRGSRVRRDNDDPPRRHGRGCPARQVNETWIGSFRGWVYGGAFGLELGLGVFTYVVTWGVHATFLAALLTSSPLAGALVGATFGIGRSLSVLAAGYVDRPSRLVAFNRALAKAGPIVRTGASTAFAAMGLVAVAGGLV
jgi:hypothetical protein